MDMNNSRGEKELQHDISNQEDLVNKIKKNQSKFEEIAFESNKLFQMLKQALEYSPIASTSNVNNIYLINEIDETIHEMNIAINQTENSFNERLEKETKKYNQLVDKEDLNKRS
ncbi:MAG: hypothetical protein PHH04_03715 [Thomasclavelia sp.]|nr:hypothetical protein [Thomasclavelia sp.]